MFGVHAQVSWDKNSKVLICLKASSKSLAWGKSHDVMKLPKDARRQRVPGAHFKVKDGSPAKTNAILKSDLA